MRCRQDEAVAGRGGEPLLHLIGDLFRRADEHLVFLHRAAAGDLDEVAHGRVFLAGELHDAVAETVPAQFGQFFIAERLVIRLL